MASEQPDLPALLAELEVVLEHAATVHERQAHADGVRFNEWEGQSVDCRKHADDLGEEPSPFEGAADTRPPLSEGVVGTLVAILCQAFFRSTLQGSTQQVGALDESTRQTRLLNWLRNKRLRDDLLDEVELAANAMAGDDPGLVVIKTSWERAMGLKLRKLKLDEVVREILVRQGVAAEQLTPELVSQAVTEFEPLLTDATQRKRAREFLEQTWPMTTRSALQRALMQLRREGECELPVPYVKAEAPRIRALRYMDEVFFAGDVANIQRANVYERERLSEVELKEKVLTEGWDAAAVEELLELGPDNDPDEGGAPAAANWVRHRGVLTGRAQVAVDDEGSGSALYTVWHSYTWASDEYGVPGIYWTAFSRQLPEQWFVHQLLDYDHGNMPFRVITRERLRRPYTSARGVPTLAASIQYEVKVQRDCMTDHTQLSTVPPVRVAMRRGGLEAVLGPMVEVPVRQADDVTWMTPPQFPASAREMEKLNRADLVRLFGELSAEAGASGQALVQWAVTKWLGKWSVVWADVLALCEQFMPAEQVALVTGMSPRAPRDRALIEMQPEVSVEFDVRDLDLEWSMKKMGLVEKVLAWDTMGLADRAMLVKVGMRMVDPVLAEQGVKDPGVVTQREIEDEVDAIARMATGIEQPVRGDENAQLRLQTLQGLTQSNPILAQRMQTPGDYFGQLVQARAAAFEQALQQQQNAQIGRTGYVPQLGQGAGA